MFNRKKHEIEWLRAENEELLCKLGNATTRDSDKVRELQDRLYEEREACLAKDAELAKEIDEIRAKMEKAYTDLLKENKQITDANGSIKHALQTEKKQSEKLRQLLKAGNDQAAQAEADKRRLQAENRALREKIEEAKRLTDCQADCKHRSNPNACRTCVRYPKAKDKYEVTS